MFLLLPLRWHWLHHMMTDCYAVTFTITWHSLEPIANSGKRHRHFSKTGEPTWGNSSWRRGWSCWRYTFWTRSRRRCCLVSQKVTMELEASKLTKFVFVDGCVLIWRGCPCTSLQCCGQRHRPTCRRRCQCRWSNSNHEVEQFEERTEDDSLNFGFRIEKSTVLSVLKFQIFRIKLTTCTDLTGFFKPQFLFFDKQA